MPSVIGGNGSLWNSIRNARWRLFGVPSTLMHKRAWQAFDLTLGQCFWQRGLLPIGRKAGNADQMMDCIVQCGAIVKSVKRPYHLHDLTIKVFHFLIAPPC